MDRQGYQGVLRRGGGGYKGEGGVVEARSGQVVSST